MIIPIRCFTCGKVIGDKYNYYKNKVRELKNESGEHNDSTLTANYISKNKKIETPENKVLNELKINRYCCRRHFITHIELLEEI
jgi:DNA-directed RNA polymerase subunit N (RpoN/RPB10)